MIKQCITHNRLTLYLSRGFSHSVINRVDLTRANICVPDSWVPYINELDNRLSSLYPDYKINQIKEKFGVMRFYCSGVNEKGQKIIDIYERASKNWGGE